jgi:replication factor C subunit 2/4
MNENKKSENRNTEGMPWIESYRPQILEDVILDNQIREQIKVFLLDKPHTHLIITGMPGVGKTTIARCIAKKILGEYLHEGYMELNAAENRGIRSISSIIPMFCKKVVKFTCSKIILLDEADNITIKCQYDINTMIKEFGKNTKFIFTCNDSSKIYEDIQSVCHIIRFKKLTDEQVETFLVKICQDKDISYSHKGLGIICYISDGDMRKAVNNLQLTYYSYQKITKENVLRVCKMPDPEGIMDIINHCRKKELNEAVQKLFDIINNGHHYLDILACFTYNLSKSDAKTESYHLPYMDIVNQTKILINIGLKSKLQLVAMISRLISLTNQ